MRRAAVAGALAVLLLALALIAPGYLTKERDYVAVTPQAPSSAVPSSIQLAAGARVCMDLVAVDSRSAQARLWPTTPGRRPEPLELTVSGDGYFTRERGPADYADGAAVAIPIEPPPHSLEATACVQNSGERRVDLAAVSDRSRSRSIVRLQGKPFPAGFAIAFYERRPASILERLPVSLERMSVLRPGIVSRWTLWPLLALFLVGVPALALWTVARAAGTDERS